MTVSPVNAAQMLENINRSYEAESVSQLPFQQFLGDAINAVNETDTAVQSSIAELAMGNADNLHNVVIDAVKAELAVQSLVSVRNRALEAYNEIMRITL